ncbi:MAG: hypothetical protein CMJ59_07910 [Planctomycetaceae bacterium]|nr:hypothetical protein [Planctomycetaceae bacterium]
MQTMIRFALRIATLLCWCTNAAPAQSQSAPESVRSLERAVAYLQREVPAWSVKHRCFSCHNNGDAARALFAAQAAGFAVPQQALAGTRQWLAAPDNWKNNGGDQRFSDQRLAQFQFSMALSGAARARVITDVSALQRAATLTAKQQQTDGSWPLGTGGIVASPITYGRHLATAMGKDLLQQSDAKMFSSHITRADRWLRQTRPHALPDLAGLLIGLRRARDTAAIEQRGRCLRLIRAAQDPAGGWGPFASHRAEPYDTAIVLLALAQQDARKPFAKLLQTGRSWLINAQLKDGSWLETTRPAESESYAHRISTTAWATLALIATRTTPHSK